MFNKKSITAILTIGLFVVGVGFGQAIEDNWNDLLHYIQIGQLDLAKGYAQAILKAAPDPVELLAISEKNPQGCMLLSKVKETAHDAELAGLAGKILDVIEQGKFVRRADPKIIIEEIKRLSGTSRGRLMAVKHLQNSGEYAVMYMVDAMADDSRKEELPNIIWALPQIGRDAIRPLACALQTKNAAVKAEIIKAMGKIGYAQSTAYLKYVAEKDDSADLRGLAEQSIKEIDSAAVQVPASQLFYKLAEDYYYHAESLAPAEDANFGNIWFWDSNNQRLTRKEVSKTYFNELMAMRNCEWSLRADPAYGQAIGLWLAAFFRAESAGIAMPDYFGTDHAKAMVYATTAGAEYLHQALARAVKDKDAYVALNVVEALAATAGEKSLFYRLGTTQPLLQALSFNDKAVRYSAAIAITNAGPKQGFAESKLVVDNLAAAIAESADKTTENTNLWNGKLADSYALRAAEVMLKSVQTQNPVIDLSLAQTALINATKDKRAQIRTLAARILAHLGGPQSQQSIADMALDETNPVDIRVSAFESLAVSAKFNASLLDDKAIDAIYSLVASREIDPALRSAAASAYGALNLPSKKVKDLILDQAKN